MSSAAKHLREFTARDLKALSGDVTKVLDGARWRWTEHGEEKPAVLAIDTGATTGWALLSDRGYQGGTFAADGRVDPKWHERLQDLLEDVAGHSLHGPVLVVVEDVFLLKNVKTLAHLAFYVGAVLGAAANWGVPALRVAPHAWQSKMLGKNRRAQGKALSVARARQEFGFDIVSSDQADAALLAAFVRGV